ncbi:hypothetical protein LRE75_03150 [Streptomyces sp. 372A]
MSSVIRHHAASNPDEQDASVQAQLAESRARQYGEVRFAVSTQHAAWTFIRKKS